MDNDKPRRITDTIVDIVSSESEYEEDGTNDTVTANIRAKTVVQSAGKTFNFDSFEGSDDAECSSNSYRTSLKSSDDSYEDIESLKYTRFGKNGQHTQLLEKTQSKEKRKNISNSKRAPKPPRPRKGPSLDTADLQLVKEIAEQTMKKRARVERLKSLKKRRALKASPPPTSSNISILAMVITVLFFIIIIFQGFGSSQSSNFTFDESTKLSGEPSNGLISVQLGNKVMESNGVKQIAKPPMKLVDHKIYRTTSNFVEQKSDRL